MSAEIEHVALWVGLVLALIGITLALVTLKFTWLVNKRSEELNDKRLRL